MLMFLLTHKKLLTYAIVAISIIAMALFIKHQNNVINEQKQAIEQLTIIKNKYDIQSAKFTELKKNTEQRNERIKDLMLSINSTKNEANKKTVSIISKEYKTDNACKDADNIFNEYIKK